MNEYSVVIDGLTKITKDGFVFCSILYPFNRKTAIYISPAFDWEHYTEYINRNHISQAEVVMPNLDGLRRCDSLKYLYILPSANAPAKYDFSPLYDMPEIKYLNCVNHTGDRHQYISEIDFTKISGLESLSLQANRKTLNFDKLTELKSLNIGSFNGKNYDISDLSCSEKLDTLKMIQCGNRSMSGIEKYGNMQCLYLEYNRALEDISSLRTVKDTLKALRIEKCPKIKDFSVLAELEKLEYLELTGSNELPSLDFISSMKNLKTLVFDMNVLDGDLYPCEKLSYAFTPTTRRHYNVKASELPKGEFFRGNDSIEEWRRTE